MLDLLKARALGSTAPDLSITLARAYAGAGKINEAIAEIDKAIAAINPGMKLPSLAIASAIRERGRISSAAPSSAAALGMPQTILDASS